MWIWITSTFCNNEYTYKKYCSFLSSNFLHTFQRTHFQKTWEWNEMKKSAFCTLTQYTRSSYIWFLLSTSYPFLAYGRRVSSHSHFVFLTTQKTSSNNDVEKILLFEVHVLLSTELFTQKTSSPSDSWSNTYKKRITIYCHSLTTYKW